MVENGETPITSPESGTESIKVEVKTETTIQEKPERPENWRTLVLVGALIAVSIVLTAYLLTGIYWGTFCLIVAIYESWTLVNKYKEDTLSEAIWFFANRPLIPLLFGIAVGIGLGSGYLGDVKTASRAFAIGLLYGHFFFTPVITVSSSKVEKL